MATSVPQASVRLGPQGRLVVPAPIRKALGFQPGDSLIARIDNERLVVEKRDVVERRLHAYFRKFKGRSLADELIAERREEARGETRECGVGCAFLQQETGEGVRTIR